MLPCYDHFAQFKLGLEMKFLVNESVKLTKDFSHSRVNDHPSQGGSRLVVFLNIQRGKCLVLEN